MEVERPKLKFQFNVCFHNPTDDNYLKLKKCSRCKCAIYCCVKCQTENWKEHKLQCKILTDRVQNCAKDKNKIALLRLETLTHNIISNHMNCVTGILNAIFDEYTQITITITDIDFIISKNVCSNITSAFIRAIYNKPELPGMVVQIKNVTEKIEGYNITVIIEHKDIEDNYTFNMSFKSSFKNEDMEFAWDNKNMIKQNDPYNKLVYVLTRKNRVVKCRTT